MGCTHGTPQRDYFIYFFIRTSATMAAIPSAIGKAIHAPVTEKKRVRIKATGINTSN